ncbi:MAG: DUF2273 domain-containing protein [Syntrophomonas sp.]|uniref:DUF2273 domain-containing protein n=1 Tax=Syntrophomonas sp. TaxID=2053627 RepID=UPI00260E4A01|nr:DUF2273 domain-containing protein [Syntrophomonas sp.]MDD2510250.1 DUF2273 domain-containing protein [Syntrophomonas sp.]MDD3878808.1 DUF2273 domain-containing protein [Syntrophomonas sp.]MDD4626834.1 DUF2273 domain-containing protein [Syntrophomonas sp.]
MGEKLLLLILEEHRGKALGILLGLIASILFITYGFWRSLFIVFCIILGFFIGKKIDENQSFDNWLRQMFKDRQR